MNQNHKDAETAIGLLRQLQLYDARGAENGVLAQDVSLVCRALRNARQEGPEAAHPAPTETEPKLFVRWLNPALVGCAQRIEYREATPEQIRAAGYVPAPQGVPCLHDRIAFEDGQRWCRDCGQPQGAGEPPVVSQGATCLHEWREQASGLNYCYKCGSWRGSEVGKRS